MQPRLVVYGHIHEGYGTEERVYDRVGEAYEQIFGQLGGWVNLASMAWGIMWGYLIPRSLQQPERRTAFVNAAVVEGWENYMVKNEAVVLQI